MNALFCISILMAVATIPILTTALLWYGDVTVFDVIMPFSILAVYSWILVLSNRNTQRDKIKH
ncbi:MAG: hypothetical protein JKY52_18515 [Flavobacteriales bacterium]|nr:hypothetical protein [Flavobacteriales bacterium]